MKNLFNSLLFTTTILTLNSCVTYTPMSQRAVDDVTTCRKSSIKKIKKNLQLAGYEIKKETPEDLVTEYKQVSGYGTRRSYEKISVIKLDNDNFRFLVKLRNDTMSTVNSGDTYTTKTRYNSKGKKVTSREKSESYSSVPTSNEYDLDYYVEKIPQYEDRQYMICGR